MKYDKQAVYFFIATLFLMVGMACNMNLFASAVTSTPTAINTVPTFPPTTTQVSVQPSATRLPPTAPPVAQNTRPQINTSSPTHMPVVLLLTTGKGILGDIYAWDMASLALKQLTSWGYNFAPRISPDGQWLAYLSVSRAAVTAMKQGQAMNAERLANIWLINPYTEEAVRVADQPQNEAVQSGNLITRTDPVWSPDGTSLAWIDSDIHGERLAIYTQASQATAMFSLNLPPACCEGGYRTLYWGHSGIAILGNEGTPPTQVKQVVYVFSPKGVQLARAELSVDFSPQYGWITYNGHEYLGGPTNGELTLVDPFNTSPIVAQGYPEMYSLSASNELSVHPAKNPVLWTITRQGETLTDINDIQNPQNISVAPDGKGIVYSQGNDADGGKLFAYLASGQTVPITPQMRVLAVTWGATGWRIHP